MVSFHELPDPIAALPPRMHVMAVEAANDLINRGVAMDVAVARAALMARQGAAERGRARVVDHTSVRQTATVVDD
ncbi:MAG: hypothetical protein AAF928_09395 [Myxococcota bacterium]